MDQGSNETGQKKALEPEIIEPGRQYSGGRANRQSGQYFSSVWINSPMSGDGCAAPGITFAIFIICLAQFGILAGIGFLFFYTIGAIAGSVHATRRLMAGLPFNPWPWRAGNWIVSLLITAWLAGGFNS